MTIVVNATPGGAATFNLTRERLATRALEKCGAASSTNPPSAEDLATALETLDLLLKELPHYGYTWPKTQRAGALLQVLAGETTAELRVLLPDLVTLHALRRIDANGREVPIEQMSLSQWADTADKSTQKDPAGGIRAFVDGEYVANWNPVPNAAFNVQVYYTGAVDDTVAGEPADVRVPWVLGLVFGIAGTIGDEFGVSEQKITRYLTQWALARGRGLIASQPQQPIRVEADEGVRPSSDNPFLEDWRT